MGSLQGALCVCCLLLAVRIKGREMCRGQTQSHTGPGETQEGGVERSGEGPGACVIESSNFPA